MLVIAVHSDFLVRTGLAAKKYRVGNSISLRLTPGGEVCRISDGFELPCAFRLAFSYFELNLTSDHAAIYHP